MPDDPAQVGPPLQQVGAAPPAGAHLPRPRTDVLYHSVDDGGVLFSMGDEVYFGLNGVGAAIWEALAPAGVTRRELLEQLKSRYPDVNAATLAADADELIEVLLKNNLLRPGSQE